MLGVIIGGGCTVLVVTLALVGKHYIVAQIEGVGSNLVYAGLTHSTDSFPLRLTDEISLGDMEAMKTQIPEVMVAAGATDIPMSVVAVGVERPVKLVGVTDGFQRIRNLVVFRRRYFDPDDMMSHAKVLLAHPGTGRTRISSSGSAGPGNSRRRSSLRDNWRISRANFHFWPNGNCARVRTHPFRIDDLLHGNVRDTQVV